MRSRQGTFYKISNSPISIGMDNVLSTVSDKKIPVDNGNNGTIDWYIADITSASDYYPFGSPMDGRTFSSDKYRFGFNGKENDNEVKGEGSQQDYGMRIYDPRLGRFLTPDPIIVYEHKYPELSTYQFASNMPISAIDLDGLEAKIQLSVQGSDGETSFLKVLDWNQVHPSQAHGPWGATGTISHTLMYQYRTKEARYQDVKIDYTTSIGGKETKLSTIANLPFRTKTFGEKVQHADDKLDPGKHGANGGGLGDDQDLTVALGVITAVSGVGSIYGMATGFAKGSIWAYSIAVASTTNGVDDAFTNSNNESGAQQLTNNKKAKKRIGDVKFTITLVDGIFNMKNYKELVKNPFNIYGTGSDFISAKKTVTEEIKNLKKKEKNNGK